MLLCSLMQSIIVRTGQCWVGCKAVASHRFKATSTAGELWQHSSRLQVLEDASETHHTTKPNPRRRFGTRSEEASKHRDRNTGVPVRQCTWHRTAVWRDSSMQGRVSVRVAAGESSVLPGCRRIMSGSFPPMVISHRCASLQRQAHLICRLRRELHTPIDPIFKAK